MTGIIYCIKQKEKGYDSPIYIGSTKDFHKRKIQHKSDCNNTNTHCYNIKVYQYIRENGGWDNFDMIEIGVVEYETDEELRIEEQKWIEDLGASLNNYRAYLSPKYYNEYCRERDEYQKKYNEENREKINERQKKYYEENRGKIKDYYKENKEKLNKRKNKKFDCPCGGKYTNNGKSSHIKTKKHKTYEKNLNKDLN